MAETPWWERRMVAFDLETTAPEPEEARIVSAALALCGGGEPVDARTWLVNPGVPIPEEAAAVHGITTERARAEGMDAGEAIAQVTEALAAALAVEGIGPLVIFNARYDLTVADREARRHGIVPITELVRLLVLDPHVLDKHLGRYRPGSRKLDATCRHYGAELGGAHFAEHDAVAAARLAWVLGAKGKIIRRTDRAEWANEAERLREEWAAVREDLPALHEAQRRWAHEQAVGLAAHFHTQGNREDAMRVRTEWPWQPSATIRPGAPDKVRDVAEQLVTYAGDDFAQRRQLPRDALLAMADELYTAMAPAAAADTERPEEGESLWSDPSGT